MASDFPLDLKYTDSHEYARLQGEIATVGITSYGAEQMGDIVFVELGPSVGASVSQGQSIGTIESVKAVSDLYAPVSGTVVEVNKSLNDSPAFVNDSPYDTGWMVKIRVSNPGEIDNLMAADRYDALVSGLR